MCYYPPSSSPRFPRFAARSSLRYVFRYDRCRNLLTTYWQTFLTLTITRHFRNSISPPSHYTGSFYLSRVSLASPSLQLLSVEVVGRDEHAFQSFEPEWKRIDDAFSKGALASLTTFDLKISCLIYTKIMRTKRNAAGKYSTN